MKLLSFQQFLNESKNLDSNFNKWFRNSKVVDKKGEPLVVYHGSQSDFEQFEGDSYFTDDWFNADGYAGEDGNVYEVYLSIQKPLIIDCLEKKWDDIKTIYGTSTREVVKNVDRTLHDGIIFINIKDSWIDDEDYQEASTVYVTFSPNQIKSSNNETYSNNLDSIYENYKGEHTAPEEHSLDDLTIIFGKDMYTSNAVKHFASGFENVDDAIQCINIIQTCYKKPNKLVKIYRAVPNLNKEIDAKIKELRNIISYKDTYRFFPKSKFVSDLKDKMILIFEEQGRPHTGNGYYDLQNAMVEDINNQISELLASRQDSLKINSGDWVTTSLAYAKEHGVSNLKNSYKILSKTVKASQLFCEGDIFEYGYKI